MFSEKITAYYQALIDCRHPGDALARMVGLSEKETEIKPGESDDPVGDIAHGRCANGRLIHRYPDRVLLLVTDKCPAHCRFCFRKRMIGQSASEISAAELEETVRYISRHKEIKEAILSGGDPLSLSNRRLLEIIAALKVRSGVNSVRIHTRYPVYDPARCADIAAVAARVDTFVVHVNHSREITPAFRKAAAILRKHALLLNQSVLLKGVNDSLRELEPLLWGLAAAGIRPYYLHYPDKAPGISHFRIPLADAINLVRALQGRLPGQLIPKLVLDLPGGYGKVVLSGNAAVNRRSDGAYLFKSPLTGKVVEYREI